MLVYAWNFYVKFGPFVIYLCHAKRPDCLYHKVIDLSEWPHSHFSSSQNVCRTKHIMFVLKCRKKIHHSNNKINNLITQVWPASFHTCTWNFLLPDLSLWQVAIDHLQCLFAYDGLMVVSTINVFAGTTKSYETLKSTTMLPRLLRLYIQWMLVFTMTIFESETCRVLQNGQTKQSTPEPLYKNNQRWLKFMYL